MAMISSTLQSSAFHLWNGALASLIPLMSLLCHPLDEELVRSLLQEVPLVECSPEEATIGAGQGECSEPGTEVRETARQRERRGGGGMGESM
jgi:hypothetical protein